MHILFLTDNFPPETNAPASRTYEHSRVWVADGHKVTVITCAPNFPQGKVFEGYRNRLWQEEEIDGIRVIRVWTYIAANKGFLKRTLDYMSFMLAATLAGPFVRGADIVIATSPQFFTAVAGWVAAVLKRRPFVFELRDIWPESIRAVGAVKQSRLLDWMEKLELFLYRRADRVIAVTHAFRDNLDCRGIDTARIDVITNGADLDRFRPIPRDEDLKAELGLTDKVVMGYVGTHGMAHGLTTLLDAAELLRDRPGLHMIFLGAGAERAALQADAEARRLSNVTFLDPVSKDEIPRYWSILDASIIHLLPKPLFKTTIPSKIFECMAMRVPILMGVEGEARDIVINAGAGLAFAPGNGGELAAAMVELANAPERRQAMAEAGRHAIPAYDRINLARKMLAILLELAENQKENALKS